MIVATQCRAARGLVGWSQQQLAEAARVGVVTVRQFEASAAQPRNSTLDVLQRALASARSFAIRRGGSPAKSPATYSTLPAELPPA